MTRRLIAIATAIFVTSSCAYAQVGGMGTPIAGMGTTSPFGMSTSGAMTSNSSTLFRSSIIAGLES
jgi:hypothetical protein